MEISRYLLFEYKDTIIEDSEWSSGEPLDSFIWRVSIWQDEHSRLSTDKYFPLACEDPKDPSMDHRHRVQFVFNLSPILSEGGDTVHVVVALVHRPSGLVLSTSTVALCSPKVRVDSGKDVLNVSKSIKDAVSNFNLATKFNMVQLGVYPFLGKSPVSPGAAEKPLPHKMIVRIRSMTGTAPFFLPTKPKEQRGSISRYSMMIQESSNKAVSSTSMASPWLGPVLELGVTSIQETALRSDGGIFSLNHSNVNDAFVSLERWDSVLGSPREFVSNWYHQRVIAMVGDLLLSQETIDLVFQQYNSDTQSNGADPHRRIVVNVTRTKSVSNMSPTQLKTKLMLGSVNNVEGFWITDVDITGDELPSTSPSSLASSSISVATIPKRTLLAYPLPAEYGSSSTMLSMSSSMASPPPAPRPPPPPPAPSSAKGRPPAPPPPRVHHPNTSDGAPRPPTASRASNDQGVSDSPPAPRLDRRLTEIYLEVITVSRSAAGEQLYIRPLCEGVLTTKFLVDDGGSSGDDVLTTGLYHVPLYGVVAPTGVVGESDGISLGGSQKKVQIGLLAVQLNVMDRAHSPVVLLARDELRDILDSSMLDLLSNKKDPSGQVLGVKRSKPRDIGVQFTSMLSASLFPKVPSTVDTVAGEEEAQPESSRASALGLQLLQAPQPKSYSISMEAIQLVFVGYQLCSYINAIASNPDLLCSVSSNRELATCLHELFPAVNEKSLNLLLHQNLFFSEAALKVIKLRQGIASLALQLLSALINRSEIVANVVILQHLLSGLSISLQQSHISPTPSAEMKVKCLVVSYTDITDCQRHLGQWKQKETASLKGMTFLRPLRDLSIELIVCSERRWMWDLLVMSLNKLPPVGSLETDPPSLWVSMLQTIVNLLQSLSMPDKRSGGESAALVTTYLIPVCHPCCSTSSSLVVMHVELEELFADMLSKWVVPQLWRLLQLHNADATFASGPQVLVLARYLYMFLKLIGLVFGCSMGPERGPSSIEEELIVAKNQFKSSCFEEVLNCPLPAWSCRYLRNRKLLHLGRYDRNVHNVHAGGKLGGDTGHGDVGENLLIRRVKRCVDVYHKCVSPILMELREVLYLDDGAVNISDVCSEAVGAIIRSPYCGLDALAFIKETISLNDMLKFPRPCSQCLLCHAAISEEAPPPDDGAKETAKQSDCAPAESAADQLCKLWRNALPLLIKSLARSEGIAPSIAIGGNRLIAGMLKHVMGALPSRSIFDRDILRQACAVDLMHCQVYGVLVCDNCSEDLSTASRSGHPNVATLASSPPCDTIEATSTEKEISVSAEVSTREDSDDDCDSIPPPPPPPPLEQKEPHVEPRLSIALIGGDDDGISSFVAPPPRLRGAGRYKEEKEVTPEVSPQSADQPSVGLVSAAESSNGVTKEEAVVIEVCSETSDMVISPVIFTSPQLEEILNKRTESWRSVVKKIHSNRDGAAFHFISACLDSIALLSANGEARLKSLSLSEVGIISAMEEIQENIYRSIATRDSESIFRDLVSAMGYKEPYPPDSSRLMFSLASMNCASQHIQFELRHFSQLVADIRTSWRGASSSGVTKRQVASMVNKEMERGQRLMGCFSGSIDSFAGMLRAGLNNHVANIENDGTQKSHSELISQHAVLNLIGVLSSSLLEVLALYGQTYLHHELYTSGKAFKERLLNFLKDLVNILCDCAVLCSSSDRVGMPTSSNLVPFVLEMGPPTMLHLFNLQISVAELICHHEAFKKRGVSSVEWIKELQEGILDPLHSLAAKLVTAECQHRLVSVPRHSCFVPVIIDGYTLRQMYCSWGLFLTLALSIEDKETSGVWRDHMTCLLIALAETILNKHAGSVLIDELKKFILPQYNVAYPRVCSVEPLLAGYLAGRREIESSLSSKTEVLSEYTKWEVFQFKVIGNLLSCRKESVSAPFGQGYESVKHCNKIAESVGTRNFVCNHLTRALMTELLVGGLWEQPILKLILQTHQSDASCFITVSGLQSVLNNVIHVHTLKGTHSKIQVMSGAKDLPLAIQLFILRRRSCAIHELELVNSLMSEPSELPPSDKIADRLFRWQEESDSIHTQLRSILHEGVHTFRDYRIVKLLIDMRVDDLQKQIDVGLPAFLSHYDNLVASKVGQSPHSLFSVGIETSHRKMLEGRKEELNRFLQLVKLKMHDMRDPTEPPSVVPAGRVSYLLRVMSEDSDYLSAGNIIFPSAESPEQTLKAIKEDENTDVSQSSHAYRSLPISTPPVTTSSPGKVLSKFMLRRQASRDRIVTEAKVERSGRKPTRPLSPPNYPPPLTPDHPMNNKEMETDNELTCGKELPLNHEGGQVSAPLVDTPTKPVPPPPARDDSKFSVRSPHMGYGSRKKGDRARNNPLFLNSFSESVPDSPSKIEPPPVEPPKDKPRPPPPPPPPKKQNPTSLSNQLPKPPPKVSLLPKKSDKDVLTGSRWDTLLFDSSFSQRPKKTDDNALPSLATASVIGVLNQILPVASRGVDQWLMWSFDEESLNGLAPSTAIKTKSIQFDIPKSEHDLLSALKVDEVKEFFEVEAGPSHHISDRDGLHGATMVHHRDHEVALNENPDKELQEDASCLFPLAWPSRWLSELKRAFPEYEVISAMEKARRRILAGARGWIFVYPCCFESIERTELRGMFALLPPDHQLQHAPENSSESADYVRVSITHEKPGCKCCSGPCVYDIKGSNNLLDSLDSVIGSLSLTPLVQLCRQEKAYSCPQLAAMAQLLNHQVKLVSQWKSPACKQPISSSIWAMTRFSHAQYGSGSLRKAYQLIAGEAERLLSERKRARTELKKQQLRAAREAPRVEDLKERGDVNEINLSFSAENQPDNAASFPLVGGDANKNGTVLKHDHASATEGTVFAVKLENGHVLPSIAVSRIKTDSIADYYTDELGALVVAAEKGQQALDEAMRDLVSCVNDAPGLFFNKVSGDNMLVVELLAATQRATLKW